MKTLLVVMAAGLLSAPACAQTVYKCKDDSGVVVFSQRPCAADPAKVETVDTSSALKTGTGGSVAEQSEFAEANEVRRRCENRLNAIAGRYAANRDRISRQISALEWQAGRARNNLAGATYNSGIRQQIAGLATERGALASAEAAEMEAARGRCDAEQQALEKQHDEARRDRDTR